MIVGASTKLVSDEAVKHRVGLTVSICFALPWRHKFCDAAGWQEVALDRAPLSRSSFCLRKTGVEVRQGRGRGRGRNEVDKGFTAALLFHPLSQLSTASPDSLTMASADTQHAVNGDAKLPSSITRV